VPGFQEAQRVHAWPDRYRHPGVCGSVAGQEDAMAMDSKEITGEVHFPKMLRALSELGDFEHMQPARLAVERS
jgi:hypothetical protein